MENPTEHCPLSIPYKKLASLRFPHLAKKRKREEVVLPLFIPPFVTMQGKPPPVITEGLLFLSLSPVVMVCALFSLPSLRGRIQQDEEEEDFKSLSSLLSFLFMVPS